MPAALRTLSSSTATVAHAPTGTSWGGPAGVGSGVGDGMAVGSALAVGLIDDEADGVADGDAAATTGTFGRRSVLTTKPPITSSSKAPPKASPITRRRLGPDSSGGCGPAGRGLAGWPFQKSRAGSRGGSPGSGGRSSTTGSGGRLSSIGSGVLKIDGRWDGSRGSMVGLLGTRVRM